MFIAADIARPRADAEKIVNELSPAETGVDLILREACTLTPEGIRFLVEQIKVSRQLFGEEDTKGGSGTYAEVDDGAGGSSGPEARPPRR